MKHISKLILFIFFLFIYSNSFADSTITLTPTTTSNNSSDFTQGLDVPDSGGFNRGVNMPNTSGGNDSSNTSGIKKVSIKVTEEIPGANCTLNNDKTYTCSVSPGMSGFQSLVSQVIKYFTAIATLVGVLFIVISGIMLSMGGLDSGAKEESKKRITQTVIGLLLLLLSSVILMIIAPWIYS